VSVINYVLKRRTEFGFLTIIQGVKHSADLIWRERYVAWAKLPKVKVLLAADQGSAGAWSSSTVYMMCGPEIMMRNAARIVTARGHAEADVYLSIERNMQCALGHCGHCQYGAPFVCRTGPVFSYGQVKALLGVRGL